MNSPKQMRIVVSPGGETTIEVNGVKGQSCTELSAPFEKLFGEQVDDRTLKPEYYHSDDKHLHVENDE